MITPVIGEMFKSSLTGKVYKVTLIKDHMVVLNSTDGVNQILTWIENLDWSYERFPKAKVINTNAINLYTSHPSLPLKGGR